MSATTCLRHSRSGRGPRPCRAGPTRRRWLLATLATAWVAPARAQGAGAPGPRAVIEAQLQAFSADDAERAFSYASSMIQAQFGDAARFMAMVRSAYPMLIRPEAVSFLRPAQVDGMVWQPVQFRDAAGGLWRATYQLLQQADTGWRINGCAVVADSGKSST